MTQMGPVQPTENSQSRVNAQPTAEMDDVAFAKLLAATVRQETESSLLTSATPTGPLQQLAFLNQPAGMPLPAFMLNLWQPQSAATTAPAVASATAGAASSMAAMNRSAGINPYRGALTGLPSGGIGAPTIIPGGSAIGPLSAVQPSKSALPLSAFPRPPQDNGRGIHWIPTTSQSHEVIDQYVAEAADMGIKWVTFLNEGTKVGANDYLVQKLTEQGIEPVMRIYTDGGAPVEGDLEKTVRHYKKMGVNYYQLYNEPNLRIENSGQPPNPQQYAAKWLDAARQVIAAGGYPGFASLSPTPGLAPGAAPGDMDDLKFLRESLQAVKAQGGGAVLDRSWLSVHNYGDAHLRIRDYDNIVREELGRSLPQIGTEAGIYPGDTLSQQDATRIVADAYRYLPQREDYYFAYTYWIIANDAGQGHNDAAWNHQALFRPDGQDPLVALLKEESWA
jgi:hypothetical protein